MLFDQAEVDRSSSPLSSRQKAKLPCASRHYTLLLAAGIPHQNIPGGRREQRVPAFTNARARVMESHTGFDSKLLRHHTPSWRIRTPRVAKEESGMRRLLSTAPPTASPEEMKSDWGRGAHGLQLCPGEEDHRESLFRRLQDRNPGQTLSQMAEGHAGARGTAGAALGPPGSSWPYSVGAAEAAARVRRVTARARASRMEECTNARNKPRNSLLLFE
ncbi:hypothetical protein CRUP_015120, partial [Coryphaenoides rupestris]